MDKVHSTINLLEYVDTLQVKVEEDTEVVHSGYVKNEEIEETDASKNAEEDPIQDINNRSESDEEDREPPGHTAGTSSERKRKSSEEIEEKDASKNTEDPIQDINNRKEIGFRWKAYVTFEQHCRELVAFKEDFGHCNVPRRFANNPSLGQWCSNIRAAYNNILKGTKTNINLSQGRIERLEEIGFQWQGLDYDEAFEKRCR